jgi:hypothetical protein
VRSLRPDWIGPAAYLVSGAAAALQGKACAMTEAWRSYRNYEAGRQTESELPSADQWAFLWS